MMAKCNLIADSCCDLPRELVEVDGVDLIRFPYFFDQDEYLDDLWATETPHDFYERMRKGEQPHTAQASLAMLTDVFVKAALRGIPTVYLSFTSGLSASYDQACLVASQVRSEFPEFDLRVVDTHLASTGEALFVYEAIRQRNKGLTIDEMEAWALEAQYFVNVYFMVEDLDCLHRGGRIPSSVAAVGGKLDVKPIISIPADGTLSVKGVARGRKKGLRQLADLYKERVSPDAPGYIFIGNADAEKDAKKLQDLISKDCNAPVFMTHSIGPVIGSHVGPGMVSIVFWGKDKREDLTVADRIARKVRGRKE